MANIGGGGPTGRPASTTGGWRLLETKTQAVKGGDLDFDTVLTGDTSSGYKIEAWITNDDASATHVRLRVNGADSVVARQKQGITNATVSNAIDATSTMLTINAAGSAADTGTIIAEFPFPSAASHRQLFTRGSHLGAASTDLSEMQNTVLTLTTPANGVEVVGLGVHSSVADGIGAGSIIRLYERSA